MQIVHSGLALALDLQIVSGGSALLHLSYTASQSFSLPWHSKSAVTWSAAA
jgi:hypothetical protein